VKEKKGGQKKNKGQRTYRSRSKCTKSKNNKAFPVRRINKGGLNNKCSSERCRRREGGGEQAVKVKGGGEEAGWEKRDTQAGLAKVYYTEGKKRANEEKTC